MSSVQVDTATPPQAPRRGLVARLLGPFHVTGVFWFRFHGVGARCPDWLISLLIPCFTALFFLTLFSIRRAIAANLEAVLGRCGWLGRQRRIWRTFHSFAWSLTERYQRLLTDREFDITLEGGENWHRLLAAEKGCVLVTGHIGNWEMASGLPVERDARPVHVVREPEMDPAAQAFIEEHLSQRTGQGYTTHFAGSTDPRLGLLLREALERGEMVALQGDRPRQHGRTVQSELFGRPYEMPAGPLALARRSGAPLLPAFVFRTGRRSYVLKVEEPIEISAEADLATATREGAERFLSTLERAIRRVPHQWYVFRELWPR